MSFWRQQGLIIGVFLAIILTITFALSLQTMNQIFSRQLDVHVKNYVKLLAKNLLDPVKKDDGKSITDMLDHAMSSEIYELITVKDDRHKILYQKNIEKKDKKHPFWFKALVKFDDVEVKQDIIDGKGKHGSIAVIFNLNYSHDFMWEICEDYFILLLLEIVLFVLLIIIVLQPLYRTWINMLAQANNITKKKYAYNPKIPWTSDFSTLVELMNRVAVRTKSLFLEIANFNNIIRKYICTTNTGLLSAKYFHNQFAHVLSSSEIGNGGFVLLISLGVNNLSKLSQVLITLHDKYNFTLFGHHTDVELSIVLSGRDDVTTKHLCEEIAKDLQIEDIHIGVAEFTYNCHIDDIFKRMQAALQEAQEKKVIWHIIRPLAKRENGYNWENLLKDKIAEQDIILHHQPVFFYEHDSAILFHNEVMARIKAPDKQVLPAGFFLPLLNKYDLTVDFDKTVIELTINRILESEDSYQRYGINITAASAMDHGFLEWLYSECKNLKEKAARLTIEFNESILHDDIKNIINIFKKFKTLGVQVGIDHFGLGLYRYNFLQELNIDFIKLDGSYTRLIHENPETIMVIQSFISMAHSLDILIIATAVETIEEHQALLELKLDGMQGFLIGQPV